MTTRLGDALVGLVTREHDSFAVARVWRGRWLQFRSSRGRQDTFNRPAPGFVGRLVSSRCYSLAELIREGVWRRMHFRQLVVLVALIAAPAPAADSVFVEGAFTGTWGASFPPFLPQVIGPINFRSSSDATGIQMMDALNGAGTAAARCPSANEKREFYVGDYDYSEPGEFAGCTNGSIFFGVFRDIIDMDSGTFTINGTFPGATPRWTGTFTVDGTTAAIHGVYQGGGIATPLARVGTQQPPPVPEGDPILSTSRPGLVFFAQGAVVQRQSFEIVNTGGQELNWTAVAETLSGGSWLSVSPDNGSTTASRGSSFVDVAVDPTGLAPGDYYGSVTVSSASGNDSQRLTVVTRVSAADAFLPAEADPEGFLFVHTSPSGAPSQTVVVTNPGARPLQLEIESFFGAGVPEWFGFQAPAQNRLAGGDSMMVEIDVTSDFTPAVRSGELRITSRPADGGGEPAATQRLDARLLVPRAAGAALSGLARRQGACAPTQFVPVLRRPSLDFSIVAGFPLVIEAEIFDDCGMPFTSGSVTAEFSNGDPLLALEPLRDGRWVATWAPLREATAANITLRATDAQRPGIEGTLEITGAIPETAATPILAALPLSAVSFARDQPVSLGAYAALFGSQLAGALTVADRLPLPDTLDQTSVFIGGTPMPLLFASGGQINGIVPFDLTSGRLHSLLVQRGVTLSAPLQVLIVEAQPALFSKNSSGSGQGLIERVSSDGSRSVAEAGTPARPGDVLVIYASGLGPVSGEVNAADASPTSPLAETLEPVTILVGGIQVAVSFAGLTPGFAGLYQVNAALPAGAPVGDAVPIVASVGEATSPPVTIAVGR